MKEVKLGVPELELAKKISHQVWEKYDDQFGYRTEKQTYNDNVSTDIPDNIWFFWGQFDSINQAEFTDLANKTDTKAGDTLYHWCMEQMDKNAESLAKLHDMGIDI
jgi:hypothetical protein